MRRHPQSFQATRCRNLRRCLLSAVAVRAYLDPHLPRSEEEVDRYRRHLRLDPHRYPSAKRAQQEARRRRAALLSFRATAEHMDLRASHLSTLLSLRPKRQRVVACHSPTSSAVVPPVPGWANWWEMERVNRQKHSRLTSQEKEIQGDDGREKLPCPECLSRMAYKRV